MPYHYMNVNVEKNGRFLLARSFVKNSDFFLKSGMFGKVLLEFRKKNKGLTVPEVAIFSEQSRKFVWRIQEGRAEKVKIDTENTTDSKKSSVQTSRPMSLPP